MNFYGTLGPNENDLVLLIMPISFKPFLKEGKSLAKRKIGTKYPSLSTANSCLILLRTRESALSKNFIINR